MIERLKGYIGDPDCYYGAQEIDDEEITCDKCDNDVAEDETLYEYQPGKYCCEECLKDMFPTTTAKILLMKKQEAEYYDEF